MRKTMLFILFLQLTLIAFANPQQEKAALALIQRIVPAHYNQFSVSITDAATGNDFFEISTSNKKIALKGNNPVSIAMALHWYLKYVCNVHLSWNGMQWNLPKALPLPAEIITIKTAAAKRVFFNYCTLNYSASWWDWKRWEQVIDFLAMNGINMPLSVTGLEAVWYHTLLKLGFTDADARGFLVGPAYFAWQWMTNIQSHGGPLPKSWIDSHIELQRKIIGREVELGMQPIQQTFSGSVPSSFHSKFPNAKIKAQPEWCSFTGVTQLDPLDPMFKIIGKKFLETQRELFGAYGAYAADPFHESEPPDTSKAYMNKVGIAIYDIIKEFDANAIWVMQSWSIREAIATMVPKDKLLILSLNGNIKGGNYWGYPTVMGNLHNFGGRINLHGDLHLIAGNQFKKAKAKMPNAIGTGLFMEGIGQNPVFYDLAFEMPLHTDSVDINQWLRQYALRRYGVSNNYTTKAWELLLDNPYKRGTNNVENSSIVCARPALVVKKSGPNSGFDIPYNPQLLYEVVENLLAIEKKVVYADAYHFDLIDVLRQLLSNLGQEVHKEAAAAFSRKDASGFKKHSNIFLQLLLDVDGILSQRDEYSFYKWLNDARKWGTTEAEKNLYDKNASMLVTQWGPENGATIFDYGWREWGGLIKHYYYPRWQQFYKMLGDSLKANKTYSEEGLPMEYDREALRANTFYNSLANWESKWIKTPKHYTAPAKINQLAKVKELFKKYTVLSKQYYKTKISN